MHSKPIRRTCSIVLFLVLISNVALLAESKSGNPNPPAGPIPIETFFRAPYLTRVRLSPDGKSIAGLNHDPSGLTNLALVTVGQPGATILKGSERTNLYKFNWVNDQSLLVQSIKHSIYAGGLHAVNRNDFGRLIQILHGNVAFVGRPVARPKNVILWRDLRSFEYANEVQLLELSLDDFKHGRKLTVTDRFYRFRYPEPSDEAGIVQGYESDVAGELALCYVYHEGKTRALLYDAATKVWERLHFDAESTTILAVEADHQHLWISEYNETEGFQVRRYSAATNERGPAVITDPLFNPGEGTVHFSLRENTFAGISYQQRRLRNVWLDSRYAGLQAAVDGLLPKTDNRLIDTDAKERYFLYYSFSDQIPGAYFLLDSEQGTLTPFAQAYPWLESSSFAPTHAIKFKARDGLELEGYLTVPRHASAQNKVPLVVLCHGGPSSRDTWGFDQEVQFLASRGYAVLQPNYRGSSGYKPSISKDWEYDYRRMHDDVTDAAKTFRQLDIIDKDRLAIMGASFGGYLAVSGAAFEDGLYRCAITNSGVFDWERLAKTAKWEGRPGEYEMLQDHVGQPGKDREYFDRISPMAAVDNIRIPVFVAHGAQDNVVDISQSTKLASQLKRRKVPVETFFPDYELHGFRSPKNLVKYYSRIEAFLARNLR